MKRHKSIPVINYQAFDLNESQIQSEVTGQSNLIQYISEVESEYNSLLIELRNIAYKEKQRLNEIFPNVFHLRITNPGLFDKSKWLARLEMKSLNQINQK